MIVNVLLSISVNQTFSYWVDPSVESTLEVGSVVAVPFGNKHSLTLGVVWSIESTDYTDRANIKSIHQLFKLSLDANTLQLIQKISDYYVAPLGSVLKLFLHERFAYSAEIIELTSQESAKPPITQTPDLFNNKLPNKNKQSIYETPLLLNLYQESTLGLIKAESKDSIHDYYNLDELMQFKTFYNPLVGLKRNLTKYWKLTPKQLKLLETKELLTPYSEALTVLKNYYQSTHYESTLNEAQASVVKQYYQQYQQQAKPLAINGITGSGKTEVFFELIHSTLLKQQQVIFLLPEIGLAMAMAQRFYRKFGFMPGVWHSDMALNYKHYLSDVFEKGILPVMIGTRSALFVKAKALGLIIIDEEHETSYKQKEGVKYNARDVAVLKTHSESIPLVMGSATLSLETLYNVKEGKYYYAELKQRFYSVELPTITMIDLKEQSLSKQEVLSAPLIEKLRLNYEKGKQSLLFLNRRGYAPISLCKSCGYIWECSRCSVRLTYHKQGGYLKCHLCNFSTGLEVACLQCNSTDDKAYYGVGIEKVAEELSIKLPFLKQYIASSDHLQKASEAMNLNHTILNQPIDVIIGTQMISKGFHFPRLTLVGVVDIDMSLSMNDLRAQERAFQMLYQVSGRSGREEQGEVVIQTYKPDHFVMQHFLNYDIEGFLSKELSNRAHCQWPPFNRLIRLVLTSKDEQLLIESMQVVKQSLLKQRLIEFYGPMKAPIDKIQDYHRYQLLLKAPKRYALSQWLASELKQWGVPKSVQVSVDVDPYDFM